MGVGTQEGKVSLICWEGGIQHHPQIEQTHLLLSVAISSNVDLESLLSSCQALLIDAICGADRAQPTCFYQLQSVVMLAWKAYSAAAKLYSLMQFVATASL